MVASFLGQESNCLMEEITQPDLSELIGAKFFLSLVFGLVMFVGLIPALSLLALQTTFATVREGSPLSQASSNWDKTVHKNFEFQKSHHYQIHEKDEVNVTNVTNDHWPILVPHPYIYTDVENKTKPEEGKSSQSPPPVPLPVVNRPLQVSLLALIMTAAVLTNGSLILNISRDSLKLRMVHFLLIRHVCITDCLGALLVLPIPLFAVAKGNWNFGEEMCAAVSTTTASCWTMHLLAVAFYRADRVLAVWLPTGRYPILSVRMTNILLVLVWCLAAAGSYGATVLFGSTFQPALALCIPDVPLVFFVIVFAGYCIGLVGLTTGYVLAFARRRRRRKKERQLVGMYPQLQNNAPFEPIPNKYIDEENEDFKDNNIRSTGRKRRAQSDQFPVLTNQTNVLIQGSPFTHRRTWSESATSYRPSTIFTTLVTKTHRNKSPSSSLNPSPFSSHHSVPHARFPHPVPTSWDNLKPTGSCHGYVRLAEDESSSSEFSLTAYPKRLLHSLSLDERGLTCRTEGIVKKVGVSSQSKSFDCADTIAQKKIEFLRSHLIAPQSIRSSCNIPSYTTYPGPNGKFRRLEGKMSVAGGQAWSLDRKFLPTGIVALNGQAVNPCFGESDTSESVTSLPSNDVQVVKSPIPVQRHPMLLTCPTTQLTLGVSMQSMSLCGDGRPPDATSLVSRAISVSSDQKGQSKRPVRKHRARARVKHFRPKGKKTGPAKRALASYVVSVGHLLLYLPAMFVVGLQGSSLPPGVALFCGIVVYCDFLIQPIALLLVSHRLRLEVEKTVASLLHRKTKTLAP